MKTLPSSLAFADLARLGAGLRRREFTAVELAEFYLDRLRRYGPRLHAVVTLTPELAMDQARRADRELAAGHDRGPLHGIPWGAKDLLDTAGIRTTWGAPPFADRVPKSNATVVARLEAAGAVLAAKLAMIELAGGGNYNVASASLTGAALNPWNPKRWTGGSSSGPGAAVAAGLVGFAIGSETWGSIVNPSTWCGIAGLRPTYGRVSRAGAMALSWTMDKLGPMARYAADLGPILAAIAGPDERDATALDAEFSFTAASSPRLDGIRIGYFPLASLPAASPIRPLYPAALRQLKRLGATLISTRLPDFPYGPTATTILYAEGSAAFAPLIASPDLQKLADPTQIAGLYAGTRMCAVDYLRATQLRCSAQQRMEEFFQRHQLDALLHAGSRWLPPLAGIPFDQQPPAQPAHRAKTAPDAADLRNVYELSGAGNLLGLPAVAFNIGFDARHKLPLGLELAARPLQEALLLRIAMAYQRTTPWHRRHPDLTAI